LLPAQFVMSIFARTRTVEKKSLSAQLQRETAAH
jgi:hypothetical protein